MLQPDADATLRVYRNHFVCGSNPLQLPDGVDKGPALAGREGDHGALDYPTPRDERYVPIESGEPTCNLLHKAEV